MRHRIFQHVLFVSLACTLGCSSEAGKDEYAKVITDEYGQLTRARGTANAELQNELDRVEEQGGLPAQLDSPPPDRSTNTAVVLAGLYPANTMERLNLASGDLLPADRFTFTPLMLEKAIRFRRTHNQARLYSREAYQLPVCHFGLMHKAGFFADTSFVEVVKLCCRLEAFHAAESLANDDLPGAVEAVSYLLRGAELLSLEQHVICRIEAAKLRKLGLSVVEAIVHDAELEIPSVTRLHGLLAGQLDRWPPDARAWIGDRALGLHTYEAIRGGDMIWLLTDQEVQELAEELDLSVFEAAALRGIDDDEVFYLQTMSELVAACNQPFYARQEVFVRMKLQLSETESSPEYPIVAGRMLLRDVEQGQRIQAEDRAACEAWCLALALAAGQSPPPYEINPLSGKPYDVELLPGRTIVACDGKPADPWYASIVVPWPDRAAQSARRDNARVQ